MIHDNVDTPCPCGSQSSYATCCQPFHAGIAIAPTAEALMRSRYSAFAVGAVDYLIDSLAPERRSPGEAKMLSAELRSTNWVKLEIVDTADGKEHDERGQVEFNAYFETADGQKGCLHERSNFRRHDGKWVYVDGDVEIV